MDYHKYIEQTRAYYNHLFDREMKLKLDIEERERWYHIEAAIRSFILDKSSPISMLDAGCGDGRFSHLFSKYGKVTACDVANKAIIRGRDRYPLIRFHTIDLSLDLPIDHFTELFDLIISTEVIEHILDQETYLNNLVKWLKPGGRIIMTTPNGDLFLTYFNGKREGQAFEFWLLPSTLKNMFMVRDLSINLFKTFSGSWFLGFNDNSFPYNIISNRYIRRIIKMTGLSTIIARFFERRGKGLYLIIVGEKV